MRELNSLEIMERMKKICNVYSDKELAEVVGVKPPSLAGWKNRNSVPLEPLLIVAHRGDVSVDWLLYGDNNQSSLSIDEQMILTAYKKMTTVKKVEIMAMLSGLGESAFGVSHTINGSENNVVTNGNIHINK